MRKNKLILRLSVIIIAAALLASYLPINTLAPQKVLAKTSYSDNSGTYLMRAREYFNSQLKRLADMSSGGDQNEVIRVLVEFEADAVAESLDSLEYTDEARAKEEAALSRQAGIIAKVEKLTGNKVINQTAYLFNGFSIEMKRAQMQKVAEIDGVKSVSPVTTVKQDMTTAIDMTTAAELWKTENGGYTGEGIVISIIDSGINYEHPDMKLDPDVKVKFTEEQMNEKIKELGYGKYYTEKVPFGYSYAGTTNGDINNSKVNHGLHVSGIAAANGGIKGVAPNAQLFGMQVFSESGSGYNDDIIKAVEDSVKLGADIINMSLGGGPGFYDDVDYLQTALAYAEENGVVCCIAAGNDGAAGAADGQNGNGWGLTDTGMVSNPSTYPGAISVASIENAYIAGAVISIYAGGKTVAENYAAWDFTQGVASDWTNLGELKLVDCGIGNTSEFGGKPSSGNWVALIERGTLNFEEKIGNAHNAGAAAVIIYNNEKSDVIPTNLGAGQYTNVPAMAISGNLGAELKKLGNNTVLTFKGFTPATVATGAPMSNFTSWGPTPTLDIKPEITAPGGMINSLTFGSGYTVMSGTSMATPYTAGVSAIVLQALIEAVENKQLILPEGMQLNDYVKMTLMNTANPVMYGSSIYPVRQQGAGLVDPLSAAKNRVIATYKKDGLSGIALKEVGQGKTEFVIVLTNYGTEDKTYSLRSHTDVYTDYTEADGTYYDVVMDDAIITFDVTSITVPAGKSAEITGTLTIGNDVEEGHYVEAFVSLSGDIDLSLPLLGYYGSWDEADRIVDLPAYDEDNFFYNYYYSAFEGNEFAADYGIPFPFATWLVGSDPNGGSFLGMLGTDNADMKNPDGEKLVFSPNGDGYFDDLVTLAGMIRNAGGINVDILDKDGNFLRRINTVESVAKTGGYDAYYNGYVYTILSTDITGDGTWDGTLYDQKSGKYVLAPEGQYYVSIKASLPGSDVVEETVIPIKLDVTAPEIDIIKVETLADNEEYPLMVQFTVKDSSPVAESKLLLINGNTVDPSNCEIEYDEETGAYTYLVPQWLVSSFYNSGELNEIAIIADDYGQNEGIDMYYTDAEFDNAVLFSNIDITEDSVVLKDLNYTQTLNANGTYSYDNLTAQIRGVASEEIVKLTFNGTEAKFDKRHGFSAVIPVELGEGTLSIVGTDADGNEAYKLDKDIIVDLGNPIITAWVTDEEHSGNWDTSHVLCSHDASMGGWTFATTYGENDNVPVTINIEDQMLDSVTLEWIEGDITPDEFSAISSVFFFGMPSFFFPDYPAGKVKTQTFTADEIENGKITRDFSFFVERMAQWYAYNNREFDVLYQFIRVTAYDKAGNGSRFILSLEGGQEAEQTLADYGPMDLREGSGVIDFSSANFETLDPIWDGTGTFPAYAIVTSDMLDEDGILHLKGKLNKDIIEVRHDGEFYDIIESEDGTKTSGFDVKLQPGLNILYYTTSTYILDMTWRLSIYYIPVGCETTIVFDNTAIDDEAVIYTNKDSFTVSGDISSIVGGLTLDINGDNIIINSPSGVDVTEKGRTTEFTYTVSLDDAENYISVVLKDAAGQQIVVNFVVIKDTTPPVAPKLTADGEGNVTVSSEDDDAILFYSLDGEEWIAYTEVIALEKSGKIYAKAVDAAGNESEVVSVDVVVPEPTPSEPTPSEPTPSEPTPSEPTPSEPTPSEPTPSEPTPSEPTPSEPTPSEPTPSEPTPSEPTPGATGKPDNPPTGENGSVVLIAVILFLAVAIPCILLIQKRYAKNK